MRNKNIKPYTKKNGTRAYKFKVYLGSDPITGKRIETTRRGFKTAREAQRALDRLRVDYDKNGWHNSPSLDIKTVDELFNAWFDYKKNKVKPTTLANYRHYYSNAIAGYLGKMKLSKLTPYIIQKFLDDSSQRYSHVDVLYIILRQMFEYAVSMEIMDHNIADNVVKPKGHAADHKVKDNFYNKDELSYFLQSAKDTSSYMVYSYFRLLAYTGMRKGEALALTWEDLDIENKTININKNCVYNSLTKRKMTQTPKTEASIRKISLDNKTVSVLQQWHLRQSRWKMANGFRKSDEEQFIFQSNKNEILNVNTPYNWLKSIYKKKPQKMIRVHGFRHTHASLLFESGASIKEVQERLGHSNSEMTLQIYTHVVQSRKAETGMRFAKYMEK